jgi:hypothetical protein
MAVEFEFQLRFEVLVVVTMRGAISWDMSLYRLVEVFQQFQGTYCLRL